MSTARSLLNPPPDSVLVLRFSAVGDVLLTAPALHALKTAWPKTRVIFGTKARLMPLVRSNPHVDEVVGLEKGEGVFSYCKRLRATNPKAVLDLHDKVRSKALRLMLGLPSAIWTNRPLSETLPVKLGLRPYRTSMPFADRYHSAVETLVGERLPRGELRFWVSPEDQQRADEQLRAAGVDPSKPLLGLNPGANWQTKRWPVERFAGLAARALKQKVQVAVSGSADEAELGRKILALAPGTKDLCGKLDLGALGGFVARCTAFVANDSGPMHMARGLCVPTLAIFGSTDPKMFSFEGHAHLFAGVECAPCSFFGRKECPKGHFRCMLDVTEDAAWSAVSSLLGATRPTPVRA